jgi:hypothetical protein
LAELDKGFNDMGDSMRIVFLSKPALLRAFELAKKYTKSKNEVGDDYI